MAARTGTRVLYTLNAGDATAINRQRTEVGHHGNHATEGEQYPGVIVRAFDPTTTTANLQVFLDGDHAYWATSRTLGTGPGTYEVVA